MSFVPDPNDTVSRRVLPKVFADVPSASELATARAEAQAARGTRNMLGLVVVLLLGMLIAAGAGLVYFEGQTRELPQTIAELKKENTKLTEEAKAQQDDINQLVADHDLELRDYSIIIETRKKNDTLRKEIREVLENKPGAAKVRKPTLGTDDSHTAFEDPAWLALRADAESQLAEETEELQKIKSEVTAWRPRPGAQGFDPRQ